MKRISTPLLFIAGSCFCLFAQIPDPAPGASGSRSAAPKTEFFPWDQPADVSAPKLARDGTIDRGFLVRHEQFLRIARENKTGVVFLGDSITEFWVTAKGRDIWNNNFSSFRPANFGISGDRTQHVLWRVNNGEFDDFQPKVVVLLLGINNICGPSFQPYLGGDSVEGIASGIAQIVETIRRKTPATKILLCAIFPRDYKNYPVREKIKAVNSHIAKLADDKSVFYLDFSDKFLEPSGAISRSALPDLVHPSAEGYQIMADAITPKLAMLMQ